MATPQEQKAALLKQASEIDGITTNIAGDIERLRAKVSTGMSEADVEEVSAGFEGVAARLRAVATDPNNPDPVGPPVEPGPLEPTP